MILIALGSNLGDRSANLSSAHAMLEAAGVTISARSSIIKTSALLPPDAPASWDQEFYNQAIAVETKLSPLDLLALLQSIEQRLGRKVRGHWAPREIDLDLLAYDQECIQTPSLTVPHPRLQERLFVLEPLYEIAPDWKHPLLKYTTRELLAKLKKPQLMGILNITPDSFSGDGALELARALQRYEALVRDGADVVDIGAESTRPDAASLDHTTEWQRLEPILKQIVSVNARGVISVDTWHAETAEKALQLGVQIINDVSGLRDAQMHVVLKQHTCPVVVMHSLSIPANPQVTLTTDDDVIRTILTWRENIADINADRLIYDPGIGFGKTAQQSWELIEKAGELVATGGRWLYGHSRKSFMKIFTDQPPEQRDAMTLKFSIDLACAGVQYLRVHDVARHRTFFG